MLCPNCGHAVTGLTGEVERLHLSGMKPTEIFAVLNERGLFAHYASKNNGLVSVHTTIRRWKAKRRRKGRL